VSAYEFLKQLLTEKYEVDPDAISPDASLGELGLDSLTVVEVLFDLEDEFDIEVPEERAEFETLGEAAALADELIASKGE